ncbi:DEAD-like helicase [Paludibacter propionicigenes WB4]|uniref:DEAD-like helicase n=1 Tax=Paludibacter propionicigenes (strain DSM 17365 / JCM 13257 / WB4) TaxID=694427 RepID=E4T6K0_PALPW|nr:DEAD/DEAH box helicase [Paludibacter propionicigenes]ADQ80344.1 DEAD-like helicase [Paludibacter propionicigenes WB4]
MVDFKKKLGKTQIDKKTDPLEIYNSLDRRSITGPLRPAQSRILSDWFSNHQEDKDLIIKLHTGEGKTLIGLLILLSKINQDEGPCLYICPNIYLVKQAALEAQKFGIPFCLLEADNQIPNDFLDGKKILITHVQVLFNGKSKFGLDHNYIEVSNIILDDSHACIDSIKSSFTVKIRREHLLYNTILTLFEDDLKEQGEGSFLDIKANIYNTLIVIPYWAWIDKKSDVLSALSAYSDTVELTFVWPIIKNQLENCQAFITAKGIEIVPLFIPINSFCSFSKANQRILMSATTQDDSFFIKGLGFNVEAIKKPLINPEQTWSGEKMLLIPSLIDDSLDRDLVVSFFAKPAERPFGTVALVSSFRTADQYEHIGSEIANSQNIFDQVSALKRGEITKTLVIVNRYDGIDLPDESCRILIIDSMPFFESFCDRYEEQCRVNSDVINVKLAQRIEQGLGRSVRGEKDYSAILIIGESLVKFVKSVRTNKYFSAQTRKQIELGLEIAEMAKDELKADETALKVVTSLINQSIKRDEGWKEFYKEEMNKIDNISTENNIYTVLQLEKEAELANLKGDNEAACKKIQNILDNYVQEVAERGWYLQLLARYQYFISKSESNRLQKSAFESNSQMLKPKDGISYKKLEFINENRIKRIKQWISKFNSYSELSLAIDSILGDFSFGVNAEKFESATMEIGNLLGFISQRPDKEFRKGPDNLWCGVENKFFLIECKSEVDDSREEISKHEAGQMNSHCGWFESEYSDSSVKRILIIPTRKLSYYGDFTHDVEIMRKNKLNGLKKNIKAYSKEFRTFNINEISDEKFQELLNTHKLDITSLEIEYTEKYTKK